MKNKIILYSYEYAEAQYEIDIFIGNDCLSMTVEGLLSNIQFYYIFNNTMFESFTNLDITKNARVKKFLDL